MRSSEQLIGINALIDELLDALNSSLTISGIGHTKPLAGSIEHLAGSCSVVYQLVHHQRDKELGLQVLHILRIAQELLEILLAILEVVRSEAPDVH